MPGIIVICLGIDTKMNTTYLSRNRITKNEGHPVQVVRIS